MLVALPEAVGHDRTLHAGEQPLHARIIAADHVEAVKGNLVHEADEGFVNGLLISVMVQMIPVHVGDDVDDRQQAEEGAVGLVRLRDEILALPEPGVCAVGIDPPPDDHGGIELGGVEDGGGQGSGGSLAVRPGNGNAGAQAHELGEHLGAGDDRNPLPARGDHLGVVFAHRARLDEHVDVAHVLGGMADMDVRAEPAQPPHDGTVRHIRAVHLIAEVEAALRQCRSCPIRRRRSCVSW